MRHYSNKPAMQSRLVQDTRAITTLEFALIATFMTLIVGGAAHSVGNGIGHTFNVVADAVSGEPSPLGVSGEWCQSNRLLK